MKGDCSAPAIYVAILFVGTALTSFNKSELLEYRNNFGRFQDRKISHLSRDLYSLGSDKLTVEFRLAILEEHFNNFSQILVQLIQTLCLCVCARKPGYVANIDARVRTLLDDCSIFFHSSSVAYHWAPSASNGRDRRDQRARPEILGLIEASVGRAPLDRELN